MVWHATKTLAAIDAAVAADDGNTYRRNLGMVIGHIGDAYNDKEDGYRSHLGASVIGAECERSVGYGWRWAHKRPPRGRKGEPRTAAHSRMLRLWNRGHMEEARFIALLLSAGIQVYQQDEHGKQFRISDHGGHYGGAGDGVLYGVPDVAPGLWCLGEFKTHSDDSFKKLQDEGVKKSKKQHYAQTTAYMKRMGLLYTLYLGVNKNDDSLYGEILQFEGDIDTFYTARAKEIIYGAELPPRIRGANPGFFVCKHLCDHTDVCFGTVKPDRNCRTCQHGFAMPDGTWQCAKDSRTLDKAAQIAGCPAYTLSNIFDIK